MADPQGTPSPKDGQGMSTPEGDDTKKPAGMTAEEFNSAFSARAKAWDKKADQLWADREAKLRAEFDEKQSAREKAIEERFAKLTPAEKPPEKKAADAEKPPEFKLEDHPEYKKTVERVAKLDKDLAESRKKEQAEREKRREATLDTSTKGALASVGVIPALQDDLLDVLKSRGRVRYADNDSDELVFIGADGESVQLAEGLKEWAKSAQAQHYLPPKGARGSGGSPGGVGLFDIPNAAVSGTPLEKTFAAHLTKRD